MADDWARDHDALHAEIARLQEALAEDPSKWSFWTLVHVARLILGSDYPPDVFDGTSGDPGSAFVTHLRAALDALRPEDSDG